MGTDHNICFQLSLKEGDEVDLLKKKEEKQMYKCCTRDTDKPNVGYVPFAVLDVLVEIPSRLSCRC